MSNTFYHLVDTDWLLKIVNNPNDYLDAQVKTAQYELERRKHDNTIEW